MELYFGYKWLCCSWHGGGVTSQPAPALLVSHDAMFLALAHLNESRTQFFSQFFCEPAPGVMAAVPSTSANWSMVCGSPVPLGAVEGPRSRKQQWGFWDPKM